ncbi:hypothetical protein DFP72DRAFT_1062897 [Ephemerocybe angulata]|uniref:Uncharacterized protein n=1 Tax=Ephemerocybe angulata TaxID=980116 RepID=A0A8H6M959_9AGAR|nr:hypothetical protein DFP72DRAFT_1062897 [Tulosesus angulatus]
MFSGELSALTSLPNSSGSLGHPTRQNSGSPHPSRQNSGSPLRQGSNSGVPTTNILSSSGSLSRGGDPLPTRGVATSPSFFNTNVNQTLLQNVPPLSYSNSRTSSYLGNPHMLHPTMHSTSPRPFSAASHHSLHIPIARPASSQSFRAVNDYPGRSPSTGSAHSDRLSPSHSFHSAPVYPTLDRPVSRHDRTPTPVPIPTPPWQDRSPVGDRIGEHEQENSFHTRNGDGQYAENVYPQAPIIPVSYQAPTAMHGSNWTQPVLNPVSWIHHAAETNNFGAPTSYTTYSQDNGTPPGTYIQPDQNHRHGGTIRSLHSGLPAPEMERLQEPYQYPAQFTPRSTPSPNPDNTASNPNVSGVKDEPIDHLADVLLRISQLNNVPTSASDNQRTDKQAIAYNALLQHLAGRDSNALATLGHQQTCGK